MQAVYKDMSKKDGGSCPPSSLLSCFRQIFSDV